MNPFVSSLFLEGDTHGLHTALFICSLHVSGFLVCLYWCLSNRRSTIIPCKTCMLLLCSNRLQLTPAAQGDAEALCMASVIRSAFRHSLNEQEYNTDHLQVGCRRACSADFLIHCRDGCKDSLGRWTGFNPPSSASCWALPQTMAPSQALKCPFLIEYIVTW